MNTFIKKDYWSVNWRIGESSGLIVYLASYKGNRVLWEGSLPYVTIDHQSENLEVDGDDVESHGPFWTPLGTRSLVGSPRVSEFRNGFELVADFKIGPYVYTQMWRFHNDGRMCPLLTICGSGVHDGHTYHPHWRFDFDLHGGKNDAVEHFEEGDWHRITEEGWYPRGNDVAPDGAAWRQFDIRSGAQISIRPPRWEDAEVFALRYEEGESPPYFSPGGAGSQPFPAAYLNNQALDGHDITLWYVAHVHFDFGFPFTAGPWLHYKEA